VKFRAKALGCRGIGSERTTLPIPSAIAAAQHRLRPYAGKPPSRAVCPLATSGSAAPSALPPRPVDLAIARGVGVAAAAAAAAEVGAYDGGADGVDVLVETRSFNDSVNSQSSSNLLTYRSVNRLIARGLNTQSVCAGPSVSN
jgi:hypothetical protein